eukprot:g12512.t1
MPSFSNSPQSHGCCASSPSIYAKHRMSTPSSCDYSVRDTSLSTNRRAASSAQMPTQARWKDRRESQPGPGSYNIGIQGSIEEATHPNASFRGSRAGLSE